MEKKDFRKLYEDLVMSDWFKKAYHDKSLGECPFEIPELNESEDERIRREIVDFIQWAEGRGYIPSRFHQAKRPSEWIDYLEKQKEQKPVDLSEMMVHKEPYIAPVPTPMVADEQKQEWSEEDESFLDSIEEAISDYYDLNHAPQYHYWLEEKLKSLRSQPKPEWSEKEKKMLAVISYKISQHQGNDERSLFTPDEAEFICGMEDKFKSLRPQSKKELSIEKAIQWLDDTFYFLDNSSGRGRDCEITTHDFDSLEEMYDSFRKAVTVDAQPSWKPSEEQMEALKKALHINPANGKLHELKENEVCILQSLLRELEKL